MSCCGESVDFSDPDSDPDPDPDPRSIPNRILATTWNRIVSVSHWLEHLRYLEH